MPRPLWSEEFEEVLTEISRGLVLDALVQEDTEDFRERLLTLWSRRRVFGLRTASDPE